MNATLAPGLRKFVIVFFDDILVYSRSYEEHLDHIRQVFEWLARDQWKLKFSKCKFAQRSIAYLDTLSVKMGWQLILPRWRLLSLGRCPNL